MSKPPIERMLDTVDWKPIIHRYDIIPDTGIPYATHTGVLRIGDIELECVVLNTGERLFTEESLRRFFGPLWDELK